MPSRCLRASDHGHLKPAGGEGGGGGGGSWNTHRLDQTLQDGEQLGALLNAWLHGLKDLSKASAGQPFLLH